MHSMILWQAVMLLAGAVVALVGRILRRDKVATVGAVMVFIGASAIVYTFLAVLF